MIFPTRYRPIILTIFFLIWAYLIYSFLSKNDTYSGGYRFNYKSRVDSTISLIENWKYLITRESSIKVKRSNFVRDSVLRELKKKPKVLVVPKEVTVEKFITVEAQPKVMSLDQSIFIKENADLKSYNEKLQHEIDSLNDLIKKLEMKRTADSTKNRPALNPSRRFSWFRLRKVKSPNGTSDQSPEFR